MPAAYFHNIDIVGVIGSSPTNPTTGAVENQRLRVFYSK